MASASNHIPEPPRPPVEAAENSDQRQRSRMLLALGVLLVALAVVLVKDRHLWLSSATTAEPASPTDPAASAPSTPAHSSQPAEASLEALPHDAAADSKPLPKRARPTLAPPAPKDQPEPPPAMITATERTVLPPLEVQVVAGNQRKALVPASNSVNVEMQGEPPSAPPPAVPSEQASISPETAHVELSRNVTARLSHAVQPSYPTLAKQMKVQGAVVLQALIGKTGDIQDLHVVTGPAILAAAAREAVRQWHFKPYFQNGQPVETESRITVNFTISTY